MKKSLLAAALLSALTLVACGKKDEAATKPPTPSSAMPADAGSVPPATPGNGAMTGTNPSATSPTPAAPGGTTGTSR